MLQPKVIDRPKAKNVDDVVSSSSKQLGGLREASRMHIPDVEVLLNTNARLGLTQQRAKKRLAEYGLNELEGSKKKSWPRIFFEQINLLNIMVLACCIFSYGWGDEGDPDFFAGTMLAVG